MGFSNAFYPSPRKPLNQSAIDWGHNLAPAMGVYFLEGSGEPYALFRDKDPIILTKVGTPSWNFCERGYAVSVAGADGWSLANADLPTGFPGKGTATAFTFVMQVVTALGGGTHLTKQVSAEGPYFIFHRGTGKVSHTPFATELVSTSAPFLSRSFVNIALRWDGSNSNMVFDGVADASTPSTSINSNSGPFRIGHRGDLGFGGNATYEYVKYYDRYLSVPEIRSIYLDPYQEFVPSDGVTISFTDVAAADVRNHIIPAYTRINM